MSRCAPVTAASGRGRGWPVGRAVFATLVAVFVGLTASRWACAQMSAYPAIDPTADSAAVDGSFIPPNDAAPDASPFWPGGQPLAPEGYGPEGGYGPPPADCYGPPVGPPPDLNFSPGWPVPVLCPCNCPRRIISFLHLRQGETHGRNVGVGYPLVGTSWLNRPYYVGGELGTIWITRAQEDSVTRDVDTFGGIFFGWDWDYYWGTEMRFSRATPELVNAQALDAERNDVLGMWNINALYYPWGDAKLRPYWRAGLGVTHFDFPLDDGTRADAGLFTIPLGLGFKCPIRPWLAARAEVTDYFSMGRHGLPTQNNPTLTFGLEFRFGIHPKSYWPWYPSRHQW